MTERTHCKSGEHLWNEQNVRVRRDGAKTCRRCERAYERRRDVNRQWKTVHELYLKVVAARSTAAPG